MNKWLKIVVILLFVILISNLLKPVFHEPRPETATRTDYGMPSTHTAFAAAFIPLFGLNVYTGGFVLLMGAQRVMSGQHTILQVIVGGLIGLGIAYILNRRLK